MNTNTLLLTGILVAVAAPGGYYIYKDIERQQCLEELASPFGYDYRKKKGGECLKLGATMNQVEYAKSLGYEKESAWDDRARAEGLRSTQKTQKNNYEFGTINALSEALIRMTPNNGSPEN